MVKYDRSLAHRAIYDIPSTHYVPRYIDVVVTEDRSRFGIYFNNVLVIQGDREPGTGVPPGYITLLSALDLGWDYHRVSLDKAVEMPERFGDLDLLPVEVKENRPEGGEVPNE